MGDEEKCNACGGPIFDPSTAYRVHGLGTAYHSGNGRQEWSCFSALWREVDKLLEETAFQYRNFDRRLKVLEDRCRD